LSAHRSAPSAMAPEPSAERLSASSAAPWTVDEPIVPPASTRAVAIESVPAAPARRDGAATLPLYPPATMAAPLLRRPPSAVAGGAGREGAAQPRAVEIR